IMVSASSVSAIMVSIGIGAGAGAGAGVTSSTGCTSTSSSPPAQAANARTVDAAITEKSERFMYPPPMRVRFDSVARLRDWKQSGRRSLSADPAGAPFRKETLHADIAGFVPVSQETPIS